VRALSDASGVSKTTVDRILKDDLRPSGLAEQTANGWVSQRSTLEGWDTGTVGENGSAEPSALSHAEDQPKGLGQPRNAILGPEDEA
jgi:hypothetical protein